MEAALSLAQSSLSRLAASALDCRRGERLLFTGLTFAVEAGECLVVTGPNGAGKTSLLRILAGLLRPAAGAVTFEPDGGMPVGESSHFVGSREALKPTLTVREHVTFWRDLLGGEVDPDAVIAEWRLAPQADLPAGYLSSGQRRRLALARLSCAEHPLWLLDEPANALDDAARDGLVARIEAHLAQGGMAVVATHMPIPVRGARTLAIGGGPS